MIRGEAHALLTRLSRIKPFALQETMVPAAAIPAAAEAAIETHLARGRRELRTQVGSFVRWIDGEGRTATPAEAQRRFTWIRLRFNAVLAQFDLFSDALTQRSEHDNGVWLAGLDAVAADALTPPRLARMFQAPPVICYLDRGPGAAIRRARTRLPGGGESPVAVVRVPRERMIGAGVATSLLHEVGHQAIALLDLVGPCREALLAAMRANPAKAAALRQFERWTAEILADLWAVAGLGVGATLGLMAVVSLPRAFVFRENREDPHPTPWLRVKLSCAFGRALYPDPQWDRLSALWGSLYPLGGSGSAARSRIERMQEAIPLVVQGLLDLAPPTLGGRTLGECLFSPERRAERLRELHADWRGDPMNMRQAPPSLVFAVIGQARADGRMSPEEEARALGYLLSWWALRASLWGKLKARGARRCDHETLGSVAAA